MLRNTLAMFAVASLFVSVGCTVLRPVGGPLVAVTCSHGAAACVQPPAPAAPAEPRPPAPPEPAAKSLSMEGYGKVFYDADVCDLAFRVVTIADDDLAESFNRHRRKTEEIGEFMMEYGGPDTICAATATVLHRQERRVGGTLVEEFQYRTDYTARFTIREDVGVLQHELITRGVNQITSMELRSSKYNELLRKARDLALADAREKADYIAQVTGWEIAEVEDVQLGEVRPWRTDRQYGHRAAHVEAADSPFETFIDAVVRVKFQLRKAVPHAPSGHQ